MQYFKGDPTELKMIASALQAFQVTGIDLDDFYAQGNNCDPFLLMLYDEGRMPFSERINRNAFVDFIREALARFPVTGTFEMYLFILGSIFGIQAEIFFDVPAPGKLSIEVNTVANSEFELIGREFVSGAYQFFNISDQDDNDLIVRGLPGINTQYELDLLFSEIISTGISPTISLTFYTRTFFVAEESSVLYEVITENNDNIIFYEIGA